VTIERRLKAWLASQFEARIGRLAKLRSTEARGAARGVIYQMTEWLGTMPRAQVDDLIKTLDESGRRSLAASGVRFGTESVFMPDLLKPRAAELLAILWSVHHQDFPSGGMPPAGRVTVAHVKGVADGFYNAIGYIRLGGQVIRADMTERLAALIRKAARKQPFAITPEMLSLAGVGHEQMRAILGDLGYRGAGEVDGKPAFIKRRAKGQNPPVRSGNPKTAYKGRAQPSNTLPNKVRNNALGRVGGNGENQGKRRPAPVRGGVPIVADRGVDRAESPFAILKTMDVAD